MTVYRRSDTGYEQKRYKKVTIKAINPYTDLALLKIDGEEVDGEDTDEEFNYVYMGSVAKLESGHEVFAIKRNTVRDQSELVFAIVRNMQVDLHFKEYRLIFQCIGSFQFDEFRKFFIQ